MRSKTSHAAKSGVGEHTARESESAQRMRRERVRGEHPPPNLAPEPQGSGALFFCLFAAPQAPAGRVPGSPLRSGAGKWHGGALFRESQPCPRHEPEHPQYRHHRPRRPRQDDPRRQAPQGGRRLPRQPARRGARHGLDGPREGEGHHDQGEEHVRPLAGQDDQHRRHPRPRGLRRRGRAGASDGRRGPPARGRLRRAAGPDPLRPAQGARPRPEGRDRDQQDRPGERGAEEDVRQGPGAPPGAERHRGAVRRARSSTARPATAT